MLGCWGLGVGQPPSLHHDVLWGVASGGSSRGSKELEEKDPEASPQPSQEDEAGQEADENPECGDRSLS